MANYGDVDRVRDDVKVLNDILMRQGVGLLIDVIAESVGEKVLLFKMNAVESGRVRDSFVGELLEAINERI